MKTMVTRLHSTGMTRRLWNGVVLFLFSLNLSFANNLMPQPEISGNGVVCSNTSTTYSTLANPGSTYLWTVAGGGIIILNNDNEITVEWGASPGEGPFLVSVEETDNNGLSATAELEVSIQGTTLSCDDEVQVNLNQNGLAQITPMMFLEGDDANNDNYSIEITGAGGFPNYGDEVSCDEIGETLIVKVINDCNGNNCWGELILEDKIAPSISCPTAPIDVNCSEEIAAVLPPIAIDNCGMGSISLIDETIDDSNLCTNGVIVTQTFIATDQYGNSTTPCTRTLNFTDGGIDFPADAIYDCNLFAQFPNLTEPTPVTNNLSTTGAGVPIGADSPFCPYNLAFVDDTLTSCSGLKIIRTWTVLNWCTGTLVTGPDADGEDNQQVIKIEDTTPPTVTAALQELDALDNSGNGINQCRSTEFYEAPSFFDDCSGVTIKIYTTIGELDYANGVNGNEGGNIPDPGLPLGLHLFTIEATDDCGNVEEIQAPVQIKDLKAPTPVCDEITEVAISSDGIAVSFADEYDDGSTDNCGICDFEIKRVNQSDAAFAPTITFDCNDFNVMVTLRVYDCAGNTNDCMVDVNVDDKIAPTCIAPPNTTIACAEVPADIALEDIDFMNDNFGTPTFSDNCSATLNYLPVVNTTDACGEGVLVRGFQAEDARGNLSGICQQVISLTPSHDWQIEFPANVEAACGDDYETDNIVVTNNGCDLLATSFTDVIYEVSDDSACFKLVRTYEIINWCTFDDDINAIALPTDPDGFTLFNDDFNNYGRYTYQQIIKVGDDIPPTTDLEDYYDLCSIDEDCESGLAVIDYTVSDNCTNDIITTFQVDYFQDGGIDWSGSGSFEKEMPIGCHIAYFEISDGCGNVTEKTVEFCMNDCKAPTPYCAEGLIIEMNPLGFVTLWAEDFDEGSFDNCDEDLTFSFSADTTDIDWEFICYEFPVFTEIEVTIFVTDNYGNQGICETIVEVQDNQWTCDDDPLIAGTLHTEVGYNLANAEVNINGNTNNMILTDENGWYNFENLIPGSDYSIVPHKNDDPLNGVTTFDLVKINRHILNIQKLDSPYKIIAADANHSESITTLDLVQLRKLILMIDTEFSNNNSWRFVDADYIFPDPENPWAEIFPEVVGFNNISADQAGTDFVAVKIGDVNDNAATNNLMSADDRTNGSTVVLTSPNQILTANETYQIPFYINEAQPIFGMQFAFEIATDKIANLEIIYGENWQAEHFGTALIDEGIIIGSWHEPNAVKFDAEEPLFFLEVTPNNNIAAAELIATNDEYVRAEAYLNTGNDISINDVKIEFTTPVKSGFELLGNAPNPFKSETTIQVSLPKNTMVDLRVFDVQGRVILQEQMEGVKGINSFPILLNSNVASRLLIYEISTDQGQLIGKMMKE